MFLFREVEYAEQIADRRAVDRHIRVVLLLNRVREIVAATTGDWRQSPVALDELQDRDVVIVGVIDFSTDGERCVMHPSRTGQDHKL